MSNKDFDKLFFSKTRDFLDEFIPNQCSRSECTVKPYRDALTIFKRFVQTQGIKLTDFGFADCTREFMLSFMEYLQDKGYQKSSCNQRLAAMNARHYGESCRKLKEIGVMLGELIEEVKTRK